MRCNPRGTRRSNTSAPATYNLLPVLRHARRGTREKIERKLRCNERSARFFPSISRSSNSTNYLEIISSPARAICESQPRATRFRVACRTKMQRELFEFPSSPCKATVARLGLIVTNHRRRNARTLPRVICRSAQACIPWNLSSHCLSILPALS